MGIPKFPSFFESSPIDEDQKLANKKSNKKLKKKSKRKDFKTFTLFEISFDVTIKSSD